MSNAYTPASLAELESDGDELDQDDRERLHMALDAADASFRRGEGVPIEVVLAELDAIVGR